MPARLRLLLATLAALLLAPVGDAEAAPRSCAVGSTVWAKDGVRVFSFDERDDEAIYACSRTVRRPRLVAYTSFAYGSFRVLERDGDKVVFLDVYSGEGGGSDENLGWWDVRTGAAAVANVLPGDAWVRVGDVAVDRRGDIVFVASGADAGSATIRTAPFDRARRRLRGDRGVAFVTGRFAPRSLQVDGNTVRWRDARGARSAPLTGERAACDAGGTLLEAGGVRLFQLFRGARTRLYWCGPHTARPMAVAGVAAPQFGATYGSVRVGTAAAGHVPFLASDGFGGTVDTAAGVLRATDDLPGGWDVVAGPKGELVLAGEQPTDDAEGQIRVAAPTASGFAPDVLVATWSGDLVEGSLALDGGLVRWRTSKGERSVPLGGEATVTCTSGTTVQEREGARVLETIDVAARRRTLSICRPGAAEPLRLATSGVERPMAAFFFGFQRGRGIFVRYGSNSPDIVTTFGTTPDSLRTGRLPLQHMGYRDVVLGEDGSLAIAQELVGYVVISILEAAARPDRLRTGRRLAENSAGFKNGSLKLTATEVRWKDASGRSRSAAR